MQKAIDRVQTSTLGPEAAEKGALAAMNEAVQVLPETIPSPLHIGYAFAKQDAYKLSKMGVAFSNADETADHRTAARTPGNKVPEPVEGGGNGNKVSQSSGQCVTAALKKRKRSLPTQTANPAEFEALVKRIKGLRRILDQACGQSELLAGS